MWTPDIRTLFLVAFLIDSFLTLMLFVFWRNEKTYRGFRTWMLSLPVMACACFIYMLDGSIPFFFSTVVANVLLMLAIVMRFDSIWKFVTAKPIPVLVYIMCLPVTFIFLGFTYYFTGFTFFRIPFLTIEIFALLIIGCYPLVTGREEATQRIRLAIFAVLVIWGMAYMIRLVMLVSVPGPHSLFDTDPANVIYLLCSIIADILTTGFFILLNMARTRAELRSSKIQYKNLSDNLPDYVVAYDAEHIQYANQATLRLTGLTSEEIKIESIYSFLTPASAEAVRQLTSATRSDVSHDVLMEIDILQKDGTVRHCVMRTIGISDQGRSGFLSVITDITELKMADNALGQVTKKLNLLSHITLNDIHNSVFYLSGYVDLGKQMATDEKMQSIADRQIAIVQTISKLLMFAKEYQSLGLKTPDWQNVMHSYLLGISHIDASRLSRKATIEGLEIYADPLLENVFTNLAENVALHSKTATEIFLRYKETPEGLTLFFEDNGVGIPADMKEKIFERKKNVEKGMGLFLVREILGITEITIRETGVPGKGARFEIAVRKGSYRFAKTP
jgi:PAS domain S-box-containing protein